MNRLIDDALEKREEIEPGIYRYPDDDDFTIARSGGGGGAGSAALRGLDLSLDRCTTKPAKLLKNDGTIVTQIVRSVRVANPGLAESNATFAGSRDLTVMGFLSLRAVRSIIPLTASTSRQITILRIISYRTFRSRYLSFPREDTISYRPGKNITMLRRAKIRISLL